MTFNGHKHSLETRQKMSQIAKQKGFGKWWKGRHFSEQAKRKLSIANKGKQTWWRGKHHSEETKRKISLSSKGNKSFSGKHHSEETKRKMRLAHLGKKRSKQHCENLSKALQGIKFPKRCKENHWFWKGDRASYKSIHTWLRRTFGNPKQCEHCGILAENYSSKKYSIQYALIHNRQHSHNRENYITLCILCHKKYDSKN